MREQDHFTIVATSGTARNAGSSPRRHWADDGSGDGRHRTRHLRRQCPDRRRTWLNLALTEASKRRRCEGTDSGGVQLAALNGLTIDVAGRSTPIRS